MLRAVVLVVGVLALAGCSGAEADQVRRPAGDHVTIHVPADAPTISAAVSVAQQGDLVLVAPGTYHESVRITTPHVTLRGESRAKVVIDGRLQQPNGIVVTAPGVAVENLTVRGNTQNGVLVTGSVKAADEQPGDGGYDTGDEPVRFLDSFLVSHVTSTRNGLYGIYAFSAQNGVIEQSYASGAADSGIYVGQCKPCHIVVRDNVAEYNAVGLEGTNASGDMYVVRNRLTGNRVGLTTGSDHQEKLLPQEGAVVAGNLIANNQQPATPEQADGGWGIGVGIDGGSANQIVHNRISGNANAGVILTATQDLPPDNNKIVGNTFTNNTLDVGWTFPTPTKGHNNCISGPIRRTIPSTLATTAPCGGGEKAGLPSRAPSPSVPGARVVSPSGSWAAPTPPPGIPFSEVAAPPAQPELANAKTTGATAVPATPGLPALATLAAPPTSFLADHSLARAG
ncbi:right-handed parallel beta-helix repeat-containing protein [Kribbella sp. NPDC004536]|uniref:right-handed parallel beta-helix repeat-containing protein n=1 Tax=Kribbella sp. NPDC004536 TaxID=3364106 RepID=UPI00369677DD